MYGPGTGGGGGGGGGGGAAVGLNGNSLNTNFKANPFPVENVSNGNNHSNLNETNIEKQEQQSSPQQQLRQQQQEPSQPQPEEEDVEVEMIFRRKSNESDTVPLHSPQNLQFCDHQSEANQSNLCNVSERPMATYVSCGPSNESTSFESDRPLLSGGTDLTQQQQQQHQQPQHLCVGQSPSPSPSSSSSCGDKPQSCNEPENSISIPIDDQREVNGTQANQQQPFPKLPSSASSSSIRKMSQPLLNQNCRPIKRSEMFPKQQSLDHQHQHHHHHHHHHPHQHHHICVANRNRHSSSSSLNSIDSGTSNNDTDNSNGVIGGKGNGKWINRHNLKCQSVTSPTKVVNFHPHHGKIRSHNTPKIETNTPSPPPPQQNSQQNPQQLLANSDKRTPL